MHSRIRDCLERQPANACEIFLKNKEKIKRLSKAESSENQDIKSHTDFQAKTGQGQKNLQQSRASPVESPVLLYGIIHLITEGQGYQHTQSLADN